MVFVRVRANEHILLLMESHIDPEFAKATNMKDEGITVFTNL